MVKTRNGTSSCADISHSCDCSHPSRHYIWNAHTIREALLKPALKKRQSALGSQIKFAYTCRLGTLLVCLNFSAHTRSAFKVDLNSTFAKIAHFGFVFIPPVFAFHTKQSSVIDFYAKIWHPLPDMM